MDVSVNRALQGPSGQGEGEAVDEEKGRRRGGPSAAPPYFGAGRLRSAIKGGPDQDWPAGGSCRPPGEEGGLGEQGAGRTGGWAGRGLGGKGQERQRREGLALGGTGPRSGHRRHQEGEGVCGLAATLIVGLTFRLAGYRR